LQKTLFLNFDQFKKDCEYVDVRPEIDLKIENRRNCYRILGEWSNLMEALWFLAQNWKMITDTFYKGRIRVFWYMFNDKLVKEWVKLNINNNSGLKRNALKQIIAGE
jgi:hypothetical protein